MPSTSDGPHPSRHDQSTRRASMTWPSSLLGGIVDSCACRAGLHVKGEPPRGKRRPFAENSAQQEEDTPWSRPVRCMGSCHNISVAPTRALGYLCHEPLSVKRAGGGQSCRQIVLYISVETGLPLAMLFDGIPDTRHRSSPGDIDLNGHCGGLTPSQSPHRT